MKIYQKYLLLFLAGLLEQAGYTFYLLSVNRYLIELSSILMFSYMIVYLGIINRIAKDSKDSWKMILVYAGACGIGNYIAMILKLIK